MLPLLSEYFALTGLRARVLLSLTVVAVVNGAINIGLVAIITVALYGAGNWSIRALAGCFVLAGLLYLVSETVLQTKLARLGEQSATAVRRSLVNAISAADLKVSEQVPHHVKQAAMGRDSAILSGGMGSLLAFVSSLATVVGGAVYMTVLSPLSALLFCGVIALTVVAYLLLSGSLTGELRKAYELNDQFFRFSEDLIHGQKELKLDRRWATEFMRDDVLAALSRSGLELGRVKARQMKVGQLATLAFISLIGLATFFGRFHTDINKEIATGFVLTLLFLQAPIHNAVVRIPALSEAVVAMRRINGLISALSVHAEAQTDGPTGSLPAWRRLRLESIGFAYQDAERPERRAVEGIDLEIERGDLVFIVGGNGSGKTTLAKIIIGLYRPTEGGIWLDDQRLADNQLLSYRQQFTAIFSDVHLFSRDVAAMNPEVERRVKALLKELELVPSLTADNRWDPVALSQGQKKRLALAYAMGQDSPVLFFDEWTADQDPEFRVYFYDVFLPRLQRQGKTVFVISHDDRYFHRADLLVKLERGRLREVSRAMAAVPNTSSDSLTMS